MEKGSLNKKVKKYMVSYNYAWIQIDRLHKYTSKDDVTKIRVNS